MTQRSTGKASVVQRKDGLWQARLQVDGVRKTVYGKTEAEVKRKFKELQRQANRSGGLPNCGKKTVDDLIVIWLDTVRHDLKPRTLAGYEFLARLYISPAIGKVRLSKLEPLQLQQFYAGLQDKGLTRAPSQCHLALHRALKLAVIWGWLISNPADRVIKPKYHYETKKIWTTEQLNLFLEATKDTTAHGVFVMLACTGCRLGELLALRWSEVQQDRIEIKRTVYRIKNEFVESTPKTKNGERVIVLPTEAVVTLQKQKVRQSEWKLRAGVKWNSDCHVFTNKLGQQLFASSVTRPMREICKKLELPPLSPHGLRHQHASMLLSEGLPLPDVSARLGHANSAITARVYTHVLSNRDQEVAEVFQRLLKNE